MPLQIDGVGTFDVSPNFWNLPPAKQAEEVDALKKSFMASQPKAQPKTEADTLSVPLPATPEGNVDVQAAAAENRANFANSAVNVAKGIAHTVMHPIQTAEDIGTIGKGIMQKVGLMSGKDAVPAADAVGDALINRYGSWDAIKKTVHEDPVGFMMDLSAGIGGAGLVGKAAGAGEAANVVSKFGQAIDPLSIAARATAPIVKGVANNVIAPALGVTTGAGSEAIRVAAKAGAEGGDAAQAFVGGLTRQTDASTIVNEAKAAVGQLRQERGAEYTKAMAGVKADNTVLNFDKIDEAVDKVSQVKQFKGQDLSPTTAGVRADMLQAVNDWRTLPAEQFHTVEGMDALKQKLGDIYEGTQPGTPERKVAGEIYNSVRQTIIDQAPEYAKIMKGYEEASDLIREMEKTLSLNPKATIDTQLRKLTSVLRDNVNTNYGRRAELVDFLTRSGAPNLIQRIAGESLKPIAPKGLGRVFGGLEGLGLLHGLSAGTGVAPAIAGLAASSPALVGSAAFGAGTLARPAAKAAARGFGNTAFQLGRGY